MKCCLQARLRGVGMNLTLQNTKGVHPISHARLRRATETANAAMMLIKEDRKLCDFINLFR